MEDGQRGRNGQIAVPIVVKVSKEEIENVTIPFQDGVDQCVKEIMWTELNVLLLVQVHMYILYNSTYFGPDHLL